MHIKFFKSIFRSASTASNSPAKPLDGTLSQQELRRLVAEMVG